METEWPCNCIYKGDYFKAPEQHAHTCPIYQSMIAAEEAERLEDDANRKIS